MLKKNDRVLICVSGGPDSMFMAHALIYFKKEWDLELGIAHLDHGIRGKASYEDLLFVKGFARSNGIPFYSKRIRIPKQKGRSIEETAREKRYAFFESIAQAHKFNKIATAHTLTDQAETVLMRIIRGTSIRGLTGIPPVRAENKFTFIRPVIETSREELMGFVRDRKISFRVDKTNDENIYFRNRVRNEVIPYLKRLNPKIERSLSNLALGLREDREYIERESSLDKLRIKKTKGAVAIDLKDLVLQPQTLQKEIVRDALIKSGANIKKLTYEHWKCIRQIIRNRTRVSSLDIPGNILLEKSGHSLKFTQKDCNK